MQKFSLKSFLPKSVRQQKFLLKFTILNVKQCGNFSSFVKRKLMNFLFNLNYRRRLHHNFPVRSLNSFSWSNFNDFFFYLKIFLPAKDVMKFLFHLNFVVISLKAFYPPTSFFIIFSIPLPSRTVWHILIIGWQRFQHHFLTLIGDESKWKFDTIWLP